MSDSVPFQLSGVPRTLLIPLLARARARELDPRIAFSDTCAQRWINRLQGADESLAMLESERWLLEGCLSRASRMDERALNFLRAHGPAHSIVLTLGAGLCSRPQRLAARAPETAGATWIEVDFPEVIAIKEAIFQGETEGTKPRPEFVASSITVPGFLDSILAQGVAGGRSALVIIEGVLVYLDPREVRFVIEEVARALRRAGATEIHFLFDVAHPMLLASALRPSFIREQKAWFHWTVTNPRRLGNEVPGLEPVHIENLASHSGSLPKRWGARLVEASGIFPYALVEAEWRPVPK